MSSELFVAFLSFLGTTIGTLSGIVVSSKLINYRLLQLEKKVDKHNNFAERIPVLEEKISVQNHRIDDLERKDLIC
ncbi:MAG: hypothetical protein RR914_02130 [Oscillospiraceae bacterium]